MAIDMKKEFLIGYDSIANLSAPGYTDEEISIFLSQAQERIVKQRYSPKQPNADSFDETEKRREDLDALIQLSVDDSGNLKTSISPNQFGKTVPNSVIFDLADDCWLPITEWIVTEDCHTIREVIPATHDEVLLQIRNPFLKPNKNKAWRLSSSVFNNKFRYEVITNSSIPLEYHIQYLKKPTDIVVGDNPVPCELFESIHREIVSEAVNIALETAGQPRFQTQSILNNTIE